MLEGKPLRYLIGADDNASGRDDEVIELSFDAERPPKHGIGIKYCNLLDENYDAKKKAGKYGPYLTKASDVATQYGEGQIDPHGPGWNKNLADQFARAKAQGFLYIELDNPDSYAIDHVLGAIDFAEGYGLKVIAKNPGLMEGGGKSKLTDDEAQRRYVAHRNVVGIIVEKDAGTPEEMEALRCAAGKPALPVWFVYFGKGKTQAEARAKEAKRYKNMGVTLSARGEYKESADLLRPGAVA